MQPVVFVGHGSPTNILWDEEYQRTLGYLGKKFAKPEAILVISAHWLTPEIQIAGTENPRVIYDFWGFPEELYNLTYPCEGSPLWAKITSQLIQGSVINSKYGLDHGAWTVLRPMFPKADIPCFQMSLCETFGPQDYFELGQKISKLREQNILILCSGNIVHNLRTLDFSHSDYAIPWAKQFHQWVIDKVTAQDHKALVEFATHPEGLKAHPNPDHFWPFLVALGAKRPEDKIALFLDKIQFGSVSLASFVFGDWNNG